VREVTKKFKPLIAALMVALPAHAAAFRSAVTSALAEGNVLAFFNHRKTPQLINPKTGEAGVLPAKNALDTKDVDLSPANEKNAMINWYLASEFPGDVNQVETVRQAPVSAFILYSHLPAHGAQSIACRD
jgi:hypothetical protein